MAESPKQLELAFAELGVHGFPFYGGKVDDEWLRDLRGEKATKVYREMSDNDPILGASWWVTASLLARTETRFKAAEHPDGERVKDFVESCHNDLLENGGWRNVTMEALTAINYGYALLEKVYKVRRGMRSPFLQTRSKHDDGLIGWRKFPLRAQETVEDWDFDSNGDTLGFWQQPEHDSMRRYLPRLKYLHYRVRAIRGNPEGQSMLRAAYTPYFMKKKLAFFEAVSNERYGAGYPVARAPLSYFDKNATSAQKSTLSMLKSIVKNIRKDEYMGVVFPSKLGPDNMPTGFDLDFLSGGGARPADFDTVIKRYEQRIAMTQLTQFLLLGADKVGSFALSDDQTDLFAVGLGVLLDIRDELFNTDAIPELVYLNGWDTEAAPTMEHGDLEKQDLQKLATLFSAAIAGGMTLDADTEDWVRRLLGAPPAQGFATGGGVPAAADVPPAPDAALPPPQEQLDSKAADDPDFLTTSEAAQIARVSSGTVSNWIRRGSLKSGRTPGGRRLVRRRDLEAALNGEASDDDDDTTLPYA